MQREIIIEIAESTLGQLLEIKHKNSLIISGFLYQKPRFLVHDKTKFESCTFVLHHIARLKNRIMDKPYPLMIMKKDIIKKFKQIDKVCYITCCCRVEWQPKMKSLAAKVMDFEINYSTDRGLINASDR